MDFFTHILLPALNREQGEKSEEEERERTSFGSYWRGLSSGATLEGAPALEEESFNDNSSETLFDEGEESLFKNGDEDTASQVSGDEDVCVLERRDVLLELGVTARHAARMMRPLSIRAPPATPVEAREVSLSTMAMPSPRTRSKRDIPSFIKYVTSFPTSQLYASCFIEELEGLYERYLDQDGCLCVGKLDSSPNQLHGPSKDWKSVGERIDVLAESIAYLTSVQPVLR
jgi:hypothetical protein